jgi:anti-sigma regulatory factor (Ser/Thr protein kinase)
MMVIPQAPEAAVTSTSVTYTGTPDSVPAVRHLVRAVLGHSPRAGDLELIAAELVTNAIRHTPSGRSGGTFTVTITHGPGRARLQVTDLGTAPWWPARSGDDGLAEAGRGLDIVAAFADQAGYGLPAGPHRASWASVCWRSRSEN